MENDQKENNPLSIQVLTDGLIDNLQSSEEGNSIENNESESQVPSNSNDQNQTDLEENDIIKQNNNVINTIGSIFAITNSQTSETTNSNPITDKTFQTFQNVIANFSSPIQTDSETTNKEINDNDNQDQNQSDTNQAPNIIASVMTDASTIISHFEEKPQEKEPETDFKEQIINLTEPIINTISQTNEEEEEGQPIDNQEGDILITQLGKSYAETQTEVDCTSEDESNHDDQQDEEIPPIPTSKYTDEELEEALKKQLTKKVLPPIDMREELIAYAKKQSLYKLMAEDYDQASKIDEAIAENARSLEMDQKQTDTTFVNNQLKARLDNAEKNKKDIQETYKTKIDEFKENEANERVKMNERHETERRDFEHKWSTQETLSQFSKPSSKLLHLKRMQKTLALSHDFANARQLKLTADRMQKEESIKASKKATDSMKRAYQNLMNQQQNEIRCFNENCQRKLTKIEADRDNDLYVNQNLRTQLTANLKNPKIVKKPIMVVPNMSRSGSRRPLTSLLSGRTRTELANFRNSAELPKLDVKIGDIKSITKPLTPAAVKLDKTSSSIS